MLRRPLMTVMCLSAMVALPVVPGCGEKRGRVPVTQETEGEKRSDRISPIALIEFSDQVPDILRRDLALLPEIRDIGGPITVIVGDIDNKTAGVVPTSDFEMVSSRIRSDLINSPVGEAKIDFVEDRARLRNLAAREDIRRNDGGLAEPEPYDADTTFALNLDVYRINRKNTNLYYMEAQLVSFATNRIVFSEQYEMKQIN